ncbi:response regulator [Thiohalobacter thiocyanaticus]|uniref:Response regulator n=1 Tax=Thiohalobacter thiocyanaticus TaxID=585455 RepID=A0A426QMD1_9GAMM|nr:response regulator [Thiohalobacter thiocyanaticus]RRQ22924.1 response regulator [Thiohalobacter thiocyanaticus]
MTNRTILLVEDNPDDEALTLHALRKNNLGNTVVVARDGVQALEYLCVDKEGQEQMPAGELPAVVLLDLNLPRINGLEVLRRIREHPRTRLLPVVLLTSSTEEEDRLQGYSLGANSYVRKPVDFNAFVEAAGQLGLYWLLLNESPHA